MDLHGHYRQNGFFDSPAVEVEGHRYTLDEFERQFVFAGYQRGDGPPPAALDPRAHFALVCGALGCPPLMPRAYRADSLDAQLDAACRAALELPRHLRFDERQRRLEGGAILDWYSADWGGRDRVFAFIRRYAPRSIQAAIKRNRLTGLDSFMPWDWRLNQNEHPKPKI